MQNALLSLSESGAVVLQTALYTLPKVEVRQKLSGIFGYHRNQIERLYKKVVESGRISEKFLSLYTKAVEHLKSGDISSFRIILEKLEVHSSKDEESLRFEYNPPCVDCALISISEGAYAARILKEGPDVGGRKHFKKVFLIYNRRGEVRVSGGMVSIEKLVETVQSTFAAVA